ncbi:ubiquinone-dependent pyruvate dehydrogenase [Desertivibrio insolitus]|uniref:ubiquinone-dependent pyruvate dehydrogenase n=1 Tax=Herbiconiux sp. SYSU D00978 TaxID=2812562 RepID=UPI001A96F341|nr:ubiquinone-dependent pyruvate dehydrogenase [Herbiconiux sp. SYSU D00978]
MTTVAENLVALLEANGVSRVWGVAGDSLNGVTDAIRNSSIEWTPVRHEEGAAFAAAGEAAVTGALAVCAGSSGPGNTHLVNGLYDAQRSRVPVLAIAAHIPGSELGSGYFQETQPTDLFRDCSVYCELAATPEQLPRVFEIAIRTALEKRGVAVVVLPPEVALAAAADERVIRIRPSRSAVLPAEEDLREAAAVLNRASRVTILAGAGVEGAHDELVATADRLAAPVVHALRGKEFVEYDNPFDVGMTGLLGFASGYRAMERCDVLLVVSSDLPYVQFYPEHAAVVQLDVRGEHIGRRVPVEVGLVGTTKETLTALLPLLEGDRSRDHLDDALEHYRRTRRGLDELTEPTRRGALRPEHLTRVLDEVASDDAVFLPDVGTPVIWGCRYLTMNGRRRMLGSFWHGTMAAATPLAAGVQAADRGRQVIAMAGDGGLAMLLGELLTLRHNRLPVKVVVYNNSSLAFVDLEMKAAGFVTHATALDATDFAAIATAMGLHGERVERSEELRPALERALAHDGPAVVDVVVEPQELSLPPSITAEQAKGFALYALRTVLAGNGRELIDLARANLKQVF